MSEKGNLEHWERLQDEKGYFDNHPIYKGLRDFSLNEFGGYDAVEATSMFFEMHRHHKVVIIGCGYGRETIQIAPLVDHVWGIDVSDKLLKRTTAYLAQHGVYNFSPVVAKDYKNNIPNGIDLVFSVVVMQHLSRVLVEDYFATLGQSLAENGVFVVQFLEELYDGVEARDAEDRVYEPSISWSVGQLAKLSLDSGLSFKEVRTQMLGPNTLWHWAFFMKMPTPSCTL